MWPHGLVIALVFSLLGFVFAAPGAVVIRPRSDGWGTAAITRERTGIISVTGPAMNILLAIVFLILNVVYPALLFTLGARIKTWLAVFNLIPFGPLDGLKIFHWDKRVWGSAIAVGICLFIIEYLII